MATTDVQYRNNKTIKAIKVEQGFKDANGNFIEATTDYGHSNVFGGSHAWFRCGNLNGGRAIYVTMPAEEVIQAAGGYAAAAKADAIQYAEQLGKDGKWYPVITANKGTILEAEDHF